MIETTENTVHVAIYDTLADWEVGLATAHLNSPWLQRRKPSATGPLRRNG